MSPSLNNMTAQDSNMSPVILRNGSLIGLWRISSAGDPLSSSAEWSIQLVTAADWKLPSSYRLEHRDLFPNVGVSLFIAPLMRQPSE